MTRRRPSLVIVAGPNGSGKTTLTRQLLQHQWTEGHDYINADDIAQQIASWNSPEAVLEAARIADERRESCLSNGTDFAYETVFSTSGRLDFVVRARQRGYFVRLYFVGTTDPAINIRRIAQRLAEGGHGVPEAKVISRYGRSLDNLKRALAIVDRAYVYDNSIENEAPYRWVRTKDGRIVRQAKGMAPAWVRDVTAGLARAYPS